MNMLAFVAAATIAVSVIPILNSTVGTTPTVDAYDIIPKDGDFNQVLPEYPADPETEWQRHRTRLQKIEAILRNHTPAEISDALRTERQRNLDRLHTYWVRGEFPSNYDHPDAWEPCFIDRKGTICAVGYLVEQSAGRDLAEKINSRYQYATVRQIDAPELQQWIAHSGLTRAEVIAIQGPSFNTQPVPDLARILSNTTVVSVKNISSDSRTMNIRGGSGTPNPGSSAARIDTSATLSNTSPRNTVATSDTTISTAQPTTSVVEPAPAITIH